MFNRHWFAEQQQIIMFQRCDHAEANTDCGDGVIEVVHREDDDDTEDDDEGPSQWLPRPHHTVTLRSLKLLRPSKSLKVAPCDG